MLGNIKTLDDLAAAAAQARSASGKSATDIAAHAGRSRDILYRLERGEDVTASALLDILHAMGLSIRLVPVRPAAIHAKAKRVAGDRNDAEGS